MARNHTELSQDEELLQRLQGLREYELTHKVLIPLLKTFGYERVEYYGGANEEGKDLVCWRRDDIGEIELTVAQVKRYKPSRRAADKRSFSEIVTQLSQSIEKRLPYIDGTSYLPEIVYFITPFPVDTATMTSRLEGFHALRSRRVRILDGPKIVDLVKRKLPSIFLSLAGTSLRIAEAIAPELNNEILLDALEFTGHKSIETFYTDIDFSIGRPSVNIFFSSTFISSRERDYWISNRETWRNIEQLNQRSLKAIGCQAFKMPEDDTDEKLDDIETRISEWEKRHTHIAQAYFAAKRDYENALSTPEEDQEDDNGNSSNIEKGGSEGERAGTSRLEKTKKAYNITLAKFRESKGAEPRLNFRAVVNGHKVAEHLRLARAEMETDVNEFNLHPPSQAELKRFLKKCSEIFSLFQDFMNDKQITSSIGASTGLPRITRSGKARLNISVHQVIETGINLTLLGDAGAGKTTSLQMFAHNMIRAIGTSKIVIYAPLSKLVRSWKLRHPLDYFEAIAPPLEDGLTSYLSLFNITISTNELVQELRRRGGILLLDGVDEIIKEAPWIGESLANLADLLPDVQIIASSRMSGNYLDDLPFFCVVIMPFTDEQRRSFIEKWFDHDKPRQDRVLEHLKKSHDVAEVIRNPLLATILCVLAEHDVPLPYREVRLYDERIRLLLGYYDLRKKIRRINTRSSHLQLLARKVAFRLHLEGRRYGNKDMLYKWAIEILGGELSPDACRSALQELIDPCNIIVPMTERGELGFGHLRFQEHLAAAEIVNNRAIGIVRLMRQEWWKGVFILYAQMDQDVESIVAKIIHSGSLSTTADCVLAMLDVVPEDRQERIRHLIKMHSLPGNPYEYKDIFL